MSAAVKPSWSSYTGIIIWFKNIDPKCCFPFAQQKVSVRIISAAWLKHDLINVRETEYETEDWWDPSLKTHIITPAQSKDKGHNMSHTHKTLHFMSPMFSRGLFLDYTRYRFIFLSLHLKVLWASVPLAPFLFDFYCCLNIFSLQKLKSLHLFFFPLVLQLLHLQATTVNTWAVHSDSLCESTAVFFDTHSLLKN